MNNKKTEINYINKKKGFEIIDNGEKKRVEIKKKEEDVTLCTRDSYHHKTQKQKFLVGPTGKLHILNVRLRKKL